MPPSLLLVTLAVLAASPAGGASASGATGAGATVTGVVRDAATGAPLGGAAVLLTDLDFGAVTDSSGRYEIHAIPPGPHHVLVRRLGHSSVVLHALVPRDGRLEINVALHPAPVTLARVEVLAPVALRGAEPSDAEFPDRASSLAAMRNHPLAAEPDAFQAVTGGEVVANPEASLGVHLRAGASDQTAYLLDGVPVLNPFHAAGITSAWNPDALSGVTVSTPTPAAPAHLSGVIAGTTRPPSSRLRAAGTVSTSQARLTVDGPLGTRGAGALVSARTSTHSLFVPRDDQSYLAAGTGDWLATLASPLGAGRLAILAYGNANELDAAADTGSAAYAGSERNRFEWHSHSFGARFDRAWGRTSLALVAFHATGDAAAVWRGPDSRVALESRLRHPGAHLSVEHRASRATSVAGLRFDHPHTRYRAAPDSGPAWEFSERTPIMTGFASHAQALGASVSAELGAALASAREMRPSGHAQLRWHAAPSITFTVRGQRSFQYAQSLRNPESVVGAVFPVELYAASGGAIPTARGDQAVLAAEIRPAPGVRFGVQGFARRSRDLALVAPVEGGPFATQGIRVGSGVARGLVAEASIGSARWGLLASYALQHVRLRFGDSTYAPTHGARQLFEGGVVVFPSATTSVRLGIESAFGRRATAVRGGFEWESCNLLDQGCEFAGSPSHTGEVLGGTSLPDYIRVDLGVRKHWHVPIGGRDALLAVFGTATNLLDRNNLLTITHDPVTGVRSGVRMRPVAPLVAGIDVRF